MKTHLFSTLLALLLSSSAAYPLILINDNFTGASGNPNDMGYYMAANFSGDPASSLSFQSNELKFDIPAGTGDDNQGIFIHFPETTLADGERLRLTLSVGSATLGSTTSQFQLTLANVATTLSENVPTNSWSNFTNYSTWLGAAGTNSSRIRSGSIGASPTYLASSSFFGDSASAAVAGSNREIVFEIHRVGAEEHRLFVSINDTVMWNYVEANADYSTFNTLGIAVRSAGGTVVRDFGLQSVHLAVIPEPAALTGLLFLAAGVVLLRRRK